MISKKVGLIWGCLGYPNVCPQPKLSKSICYYISLESLSRQLSNAPMINKNGWVYQKLLPYCLDMYMDNSNVFDLPPGVVPS